MEKKNKLNVKVIVIISVTIVFVISSWLLSFFLIPKYFNTPTEQGVFGDMFGAVNALFSGLAFAGVIIALYLQKQELSLQREELEETREELKGQKEQLEQQNLTFKKQRFENTFFQLLQSHQYIVESVITFEKMSGETFEHKGTGFFKKIYSVFKKEKMNDLAFTILDEAVFLNALNKVYPQFFHNYHDQLGHYFTNLYNIVKFIDRSEIDDKKFYTNLLRAKLSNNELLLLFYNCLYKYGKDKFKPRILKVIFIITFSKRFLKIVFSSFLFRYSI